MIHEQNIFRIFGKDVSNIINNIMDCSSDSLLIEPNIHYCGKNDKNRNSSKSYYLNLNTYCYDNTKYIISNENINDSSTIVFKKGINNPLSITKTTLKRKNNYNKKEEFLTEILIGFKFDEKINLPEYSNNIFRCQDIKDINEKHRGVVIEWLSYINHYFNKSNETLFLSVNIMDRYTSKKRISLDIYQLVGISSFLIASKYEDINSPPIDKLIYISKNIYNHDDIVSMEKEILSTLNYDIFFVSPFHFFSFFYIVSETNNKQLFYLGNLILEICLLNTEIMSYSQSLLAISVIHIAEKCLQIIGGTNNIKLFYNYSEREIREIQKKIILFLSHIVYNDKNNLIMEKFEKKKYMSVSYIFKCDKKSHIRYNNSWK